MFFFNQIFNGYFKILSCIFSKFYSFSLIDFFFFTNLFLKSFGFLLLLFDLVVNFRLSILTFSSLYGRFTEILLVHLIFF